MPVLEHLRELRRRLVFVVIFILAGAVIGWFLYNPILHVLEHPYCDVPVKYRFSSNSRDCQLIYTGVLDGINTRLKVAVITGSIVTAPLWLYQIWGFITPGLRRNERRYTVAFVLSSTILFATGMSLAYLVLNKGLSAVLILSGSGTQALLTINNYLGFVTLMLVAFGAAFELPLLIVMANLAGVLPARVLRKCQRIAIFLIFVFAAVATPTTDPFTMCAMAIPMVALYEGAVVVATVHDRRRQRRELSARSGEDATRVEIG